MKDSLRFFCRLKNTAPKEQALEFYFSLSGESGESEVLRRGLNARWGVVIPEPQFLPLGNVGDLSERPTRLNPRTG